MRTPAPIAALVFVELVCGLSGSRLERLGGAVGVRFRGERFTRPRDRLTVARAEPPGVVAARVGLHFELHVVVLPSPARGTGCRQYGGAPRSVSIHGDGDPATASSVAAMLPPDPLVARLRAAGRVV